MVSALSGSITRVRAEEFSDIRTYGAPDVIRDWMLFGKTPEEARQSIMAEALGAGFGQSVHMVADELGFAIDPDLRTTHEMAVATAPIESPIGPIAPGLVAAQRFRWEGLVDGEPVVTAAVNWLMGEEHLDPPWRFGADGEHFEVEITGDPDCLVTFRKLHPDVDRSGPGAQPRHRGHGDALRQCGALRLRGRARPAHLPRDAPRRGPCPQTHLIIDHERPATPTGHRVQSAELTASSSPRGCTDASSGRRRSDLSAMAAGTQPTSVSFRSTPGGTISSIRSSTSAPRRSSSAGSCDSRCSIVRGPMMGHVTPGCASTNPSASSISDSPASSASAAEPVDRLELGPVAAGSPCRSGRA